MKAIIVVILGLFLTGCKPEPKPLQATLFVPSIECPSPEVFISVSRGESESQVSDKMKIKGVIDSYSKVGNFEFKTLKWQCDSKIYSVTFKNGFVDSKFML